MLKLSISTCGAALSLSAIFAGYCRGESPTATVLREADANHDRVLSQAEVTAGLRRQVGLRPGANSAALAQQQALFHGVFGPGPTYPVQDLADHPYFNPKIFGLPQAPPHDDSVDTIDDTVSEDEYPLKIRRTLDDLMEPKFSAAKGALISYSNDFNSKSDQWSFHGIVGLNLTKKTNVHVGEEATGVRPAGGQQRTQGISHYWLIPSVQWDKVTSSRGNADEIDSLISRVSTGFAYATPGSGDSLLDGFRFNFSGSYSTDSNGERGVVAGELDIKPYKITSSLFGQGLNAGFQQAGIFGLRPEFAIHAEGGSVTKDGGDPTLQQGRDFLRAGFDAGMSVRFEQKSGRFFALRGLLLHAGLQYYADVTDSGPDVDLFTASVEWTINPPKPGDTPDRSHYTLSAEYRNGRAPLLLERDNRITIGLGVKF